MARVLALSLLIMLACGPMIAAQSPFAAKLGLPIIINEQPAAGGNPNPAAPAGLLSLPPPSLHTPINRLAPVQMGEQQKSDKGEEKSNEPKEKETREDPIETDRDSFTPATKTVERHRSILESSYSFIENRGAFETHSFPEMLYRYGLTDRLELRLGWNYEVGGSGNSVSGAEGFQGFEGAGIERDSRVLYGFKAMVSDQCHWIPQSSFLAQGFTPTSGKETDTQLMVGYVFGWKFANCWKLDTAVRYSTASAEEDHFDIWAPSTVLRIPIGERWAVHGEYFGLFADRSQSNFTRHYLSPGVHYLINDNLEVGIRVGWGLNNQSARLFSNVGFGWRF